MTVRSKIASKTDSNVNEINNRALAQNQWMVAAKHQMLFDFLLFNGAGTQHEQMKLIFVDTTQITARDVTFSFPFDLMLFYCHAPFHFC